MNLSIIVPVYNNSKTIEPLVERLYAALAGRVSDLQVVLVNDGSRDASWARIAQMCDKHPGVVGVNLARNFGQHAAIKAALHYATGSHIVLMDADLEDAPEHVTLLLDALTPDIDCVYTVVARDRVRLTSVLFHRISGIFTRSEVPAGVGTMRLFSRKFADALMHFPERRPVWGPIMHSLGFRHAVVRLPKTGARETSTYNMSKRIRLAMDFLIANTSVPFTLIFYVAAALFLASFGYAALILAQYLFKGATAPSGVSLIAFLILALFSFNFLFLAIMGLYIHRIMVETLGRPLFVVSDTLNTSQQIITDKMQQRASP